MGPYTISDMEVESAVDGDRAKIKFRAQVELTEPLVTSPSAEAMRPYDDAISNLQNVEYEINQLRRNQFYDTMPSSSRQALDETRHFNLAEIAADQGETYIIDGELIAEFAFGEWEYELTDEHIEDFKEELPYVADRRNSVNPKGENMIIIGGNDAAARQEVNSYLQSRQRLLEDSKGMIDRHVGNLIGGLKNQIESSDYWVLKAKSRGGQQDIYINVLPAGADPNALPIEMRTYGKWDSARRGSFKFSVNNQGSPQLTLFSGAADALGSVGGLLGERSNIEVPLSETGSKLFSGKTYNYEYLITPTTKEQYDAIAKQANEMFGNAMSMTAEGKIYQLFIVEMNGAGSGEYMIEFKRSTPGSSIVEAQIFNAADPNTRRVFTGKVTDNLFETGGYPIALSSSRGSRQNHGGELLTSNTTWEVKLKPDGDDLAGQSNKWKWTLKPVDANWLAQRNAELQQRETTLKNAFALGKRYRGTISHEGYNSSSDFILETTQVSPTGETLTVTFLDTRSGQTRTFNGVFNFNELSAESTGDLTLSSPQASYDDRRKENPIISPDFEKNYVLKVWLEGDEVKLFRYYHNNNVTGRLYPEGSLGAGGSMTPTAGGASMVGSASTSGGYSTGGSTSTGGTGYSTGGSTSAGGNNSAGGSTAGGATSGGGSAGGGYTQIPTAPIMPTMPGNYYLSGGTSVELTDVISAKSDDILDSLFGSIVSGEQRILMEING